MGNGYIPIPLHTFVPPHYWHDGLNEFHLDDESHERKYAERLTRCGLNENLKSPKRAVKNH